MDGGRDVDRDLVRCVQGVKLSDHGLLVER